MAETQEKLSAAEKLIEFIQKNRRLLLAGFVVIAVGLLGAIVGLTVRERVVTNAFIRLDEFALRHDELMPYFEGEDVSRQPEINALIEELSAFASRNSGAVAARAFNMLASIYWAQERWSEAERAWTAVADAAPRPHLSPISLFNAAVAVEYEGDLESAIALHTRVVQDHEHVFFIAVRSQFSIGRLNEARGDIQAAIAAYQGLLSRWPHDPHYANLAQSRIIVLSD
ncbi:MAG: tetratricopeptide repeat protein [Treponema sp.]|nr:tetratricopeptide repeat protein [Treponema sp.]